MTIRQIGKLTVGWGLASAAVALAVASYAARGDVPPGDAKQDVKPAAGSASSDKATTVPRLPARPRGRLPNFYGEVVTNEQRERIYAIQAKYDAELQKLEATLKELEAKESAEVEAVLTPDQKAKVVKLRADAEAKRRDAAKGADAKPDGASK